jgi:hypothetical protein
MDKTSSVERARRILVAHGWNTTCFQIANPDIETRSAKTGTPSWVT